MTGDLSNLFGDETSGVKIDKGLKPYRVKAEYPIESFAVYSVGSRTVPARNEGDARILAVSRYNAVNIIEVREMGGKK